MDNLLITILLYINTLASIITPSTNKSLCQSDFLYFLDRCSGQVFNSFPALGNLLFTSSGFHLLTTLAVGKSRQATASHYGNLPRNHFFIISRGWRHSKGSALKHSLFSISRGGWFSQMVLAG